MCTLSANSLQKIEIRIKSEFIISNDAVFSLLPTVQAFYKHYSISPPLYTLREDIAQIMLDTFGVFLF